MDRRDYRKRDFQLEMYFSLMQANPDIEEQLPQDKKEAFYKKFPHLWNPEVIEKKIEFINEFLDLPSS